MPAARIPDAMKKCLFLTCALVFSHIICPHRSFAGARGISASTREYLAGIADLRRWSFGLNSAGGEREMNVGRQTLIMKSRNITGAIGYECLPWLAPYLTVGSSKTRVGAGASEYSDGEPQYGIGVWLNLLEHDIPSPAILEEKLRLNAGSQFSIGEADWENGDAEWNEISAFFTASIINEVEGNNIFLLDSIAFFTGVLWSDFVGSSISTFTYRGDLNEDQALGFTAGVEVFFTKTISCHAAIEKFDSDGYSAGLHARF